ncbi:unnamed protein product, partial [Porites evermanni]
QQKSANTNKKTATDMNTLLCYMEAISMKNEKTESLPASELDHFLSKFFLNAHKKNREEYEPATVSSFQRSIQRYLSEKKYLFNILKDNEFEKSTKVLAAKPKSLVHEHDKGNKLQAAQAINKLKEDALFEGEEFRGHQRAFQPKIYATNTARCPVSFYKKFHSGNEHTRITILLGVWFMKAPLGKNEIGNEFPTKFPDWKTAGLHGEGKQVTNHSVRKSCISRFLDADVPENFVAQLNGHKSTESLQSYKSASAKHQKRMSLTLSRADLSRSRDDTLSSVHN